ncbi:MAG: ribosomal protein S18-alanine N-acetyltransferase [Maricaulaceae bacterium]|jgi:ribosomal-protein-alanine N-acetyltransferase
MTTADRSGPNGSREIFTVGASAAYRLARLQAAAFDQPRDKPWGPQFFASIIHLPGTIAVLAVEDEEDVGYALARAIAGEAEIISIGVLAAARRRGLGRALLDRTLAAAFAAGARSVHLEVSVDNAAAQTLYLRAGFAKAGVRRGYYGDGSDALVLERALAPSDDARDENSFDAAP